MNRKVIVPSILNPYYVFPVENYGKKVEITIIEEKLDHDLHKEPSIKELLKDFTFNSGGFKFDRNEAND